jgi:hypothetical protein
MNRRGFLQLLGAAGAIAATGLSLEELLAPEKTIFLPAPQELALAPAVIEIGDTNLFIPSLWSNEILAACRNSIVLSTRITSEWNKYYARQGNIGSFHIFEDRLRAY